MPFQYLEERDDPVLIVLSYQLINVHLIIIRMHLHKGKFFYGIFAIELSKIFLTSMSSKKNSIKISHHIINWTPYLTRYIIPLVILAAILAFVAAPKPLPKNPYPMSVMERHSPFRYIGSFNRDFNDLNDIQLESAIRLGIPPADTRETLMNNKNLINISDSKLFKLDNLTHSMPLLIPEAAILLDDISRAFTEALQKDTLPLYQPIITSVTRTNEDVRGLSRGNLNASRNSTHRYGTTFDISWKRFHKMDMNDPRTLDDYELKHLLAIILKELHEQNRCYIKHERKQACFHITAR